MKAGEWFDEPMVDSNTLKERISQLPSYTGRISAVASDACDYALPCDAIVRKLGDMYSVQVYPTVEIDGNREPMFLGGIQFRLADGKPVNITTDPTEWNRRLEIREQESRE